MSASLASQEVREAAMAEFVEDFTAPSSRGVAEAKLRTITKALGFWGYEVMPPSVEKVHSLGAALKRGGYRSAAQCFSLYRGLAERQGFELRASEVRAIQDAVRSCDRGVGGPVKAMALPFERLGELPGQRQAWVKGGPLSPRNALVAGSWFLMRDI